MSKLCLNILYFFPLCTSWKAIFTDNYYGVKLLHLNCDWNPLNVKAGGYFLIVIIIAVIFIFLTFQNIKLIENYKNRFFHA